MKQDHKKSLFWNAIILSLVAAAFPLICTPVWAQDGVGIVSAVEGKVEVLSGETASIGPTGWEALHLRDDVYAKDIIRTGERSRTQVAFEDQSILNVGPATQVRVEKYLSGNAGESPVAIFNLLRGAVRAVVSPLIGKNARFEIHTRTTVAGVRGTDFFVRLVGNETEITTVEGAVAVRNANPAIPGEVIVSAGQSTTLTADRPPTPPQTASPAAIKEIGQETGLEGEFGGRKEMKEYRPDPGEQGKRSTRSPAPGLIKKLRAQGQDWKDIAGQLGIADHRNWRNSGAVNLFSLAAVGDPGREVSKNRKAVRLDRLLSQSTKIDLNSGSSWGVGSPTRDRGRSGNRWGGDSRGNALRSSENIVSKSVSRRESEGGGGGSAVGGGSFAAPPGLALGQGQDNGNAPDTPPGQSGAPGSRGHGNGHGRGGK